MSYFLRSRAVASLFCQGACRDGASLILSRS